MNQWDQLKDIFGCPWEEGVVPECAADNVYIAWPSIISCIEREIPDPSNKRALDFGCGGGLFCRKLSQIGFEVTGYDDSEELIRAAKLNVPDKVSISSCKSVMREHGKYDLISSIMVFQFIRDIEPTISEILSLLKPDGLVIFAVFNPEFIEVNSNTGPFSGFSSYRTGTMELKQGVKIPVYNRRNTDYQKLFGNHGFEEVYSDFPPFTEGFLSEYEVPFLTDHSEFQIQAFRNKNTQ